MWDHLLKIPALHLQFPFLGWYLLHLMVYLKVFVSKA